MERCTKYVEFCPANYDSFSNEFAKIIMSAAAECENVLKDLCKLIDSSLTPRNIADIYPILFSSYPKFGDIEVGIPRYKLILKPWEDWTSTNRPDWWSKGYNKIKHERTQNFDKANLQNVILSLAGLFTAILYYHHKETGGIEIDYGRLPALFDITESGVFDGGPITTTYDIPI